MAYLRTKTATFVLSILATTSVAHAAGAYLLYDDAHEFHGCLNCGPFDQASVCNEFGKFGSPFASGSIWNQFGEVGSEFRQESPWNEFAQGLRVVDEKGNYYGRLSKNKFATDRMTALDQWFDFHERLEGDLDALRKLVCPK